MTLVCCMSCGVCVNHGWAWVMGCCVSYGVLSEEWFVRCELFLVCFFPFSFFWFVCLSLCVLWGPPGRENSKIVYGTVALKISVYIWQIVLSFMSGFRLDQEHHHLNLAHIVMVFGWCVASCCGVMLSVWCILDTLSTRTSQTSCLIGVTVYCLETTLDDTVRIY